jgi:hypothetical protein
MTLSVQISAEQEMRLRERAAAAGKDLAIFVSELLETAAGEAGKRLGVTDPTSRSNFVLVSAAEYDRLVQAEELAALRETYPAQDAIAHSAGWDDPEMDVYDNYDAHRQES